MHHVLLDTSVYRADPRRSKAAFKSLALSCRAGVIRLHVPFVVQHEFLSAVQAQIRDKLREARQAVGGLHRGAIDPELKAKGRRLENEIERLGEELVEEARVTFVAWLELHRAVIHPVADSHGQRVLVKYFSGDPPFRAPKSRDDFPDAFIAALIEDLDAQGDKLHVVSGDARLRASVTPCANVSVNESLDDLMTALASEEEGGCTAQNLRTASRVVADVSPGLWKGLEGALSMVLADESVVVALGDRELSCRVSYVDTVFNVTVDGEGLNHLGRGVCVVPFEARVHAGIVYSVERNVYDDLPEVATDDLVVVLEDDHQYAVAEERGATVVGVLRLELDHERLEREWMSDGAVREMLQESLMTLDSARVCAVDPRPRSPDDSDSA